MDIKEKRARLQVVKNYILSICSGFSYTLGFSPCWFGGEDIGGTDGRSIRLGEKFFELDIKEQAGYLLSKPMSIFLFQIPRLKRLDYFNDLGILAALLTVNNAVDKMGALLVKLPEGSPRFSDFGNLFYQKENSSMEQVLKILVDNSVQIPAGFSPDFEEDYGDDKLPEHLQEFYKKHEEDQEKDLQGQMQSMKNELIAQGTEAGNFFEQWKELLPVKTPWQRIIIPLRHQFNDLIKKNFIPNPRKPARAMRSIPEANIWIPSYKYSDNAKPEHLLLVDSSGSIHYDSKEVQRLFSELIVLLKEHGITGWIGFADTKLQAQENGELLIKYNDSKDLLKDLATGKTQSRGGGGTDFARPLKQALELKPKIKHVIYLTDGYGNFGDPIPGVRVVWAMTTDEVPDWGERIQLVL